MSNNLATGNEKDYVINFWEGEPLFVTKTIADDLREKSRLKVETFIINKTLYNFKSVNFIGSKLEFAIRFPSKQPQNYHEPYKNGCDSLQDIADKFSWITKTYKFSDVLKLVTLTHSRMLKLKTHEDFQNFCFVNKAITADGSVYTARYIDDNGKVQRGVFALPFFEEIWRFIQKNRDGKDYAEQMSWDQILQEAK